MTEKMSIDGPVRVSLGDSSAAAVAYTLMQFIGSQSSTRNDEANRQYWLTLYRQCYKAANGQILELILKEN